MLTILLQTLNKRIRNRASGTYLFVKYKDPALSCVSSIFNLILDTSNNLPSAGIEIGDITTIFTYLRFMLMEFYF